MFRLFVVVVTLSACIADEEPQASAAPDPILVHNDHYHRVEAHRLKEGLARLRGDLQRVVQEKRVRDEHRHERYRDERHRADHHDDGRWWEHRDERHDHDEPEGPVILRSIRPDEHGQHKPDIARQNKIIADVYSPDYAEPTWVLDYRYLKSGGRDYTRGPGGQIIILPKGIRTNEPKEFKNYDQLIEHLRLKNLAERKKPQYFMPLGEGADDHKGPDRSDDRRDDDDDDLWKHLHTV